MPYFRKSGNVQVSRFAERLEELRMQQADLLEKKELVKT